MKLSHQYAANGLAGYLRNPETGEMLHFEFGKGKNRLFFQAVVGDKHLDGYFKLESITTDDPTDDVDMQLRVEFPMGPVGENLDVKPPRPAAPRYDVDGMPMIDGPVEALDDAHGTIQEEGPDLIHEKLRTDEERLRESNEDSMRKAASDLKAADVDGSPMEGVKSLPAAGPQGKPKGPVDPTSIPEGPALGYQGDPKRHAEEWEVKQKALDERRASIEAGQLEGVKAIGKAGKLGKPVKTSTA